MDYSKEKFGHQRCIMKPFKAVMKNVSVQNNFIWIFCFFTKLSFFFSLLLLWQDRYLIFSDSGLLPMSILKDYLPADSIFILSYLDPYILPIGFVLLGLSFFPRIDTIALILLSFYSYYLHQRLWIFNHIGDSVYIYFFLISACFSKLNWRNRGDYWPVNFYLPVLILRLTIYAVNFGNKLNSSWVDGNGLAQVFAHKELNRFQFLGLASPSTFMILNYLVMVIFFGITIMPVLPLRWRRTRYVLIGLCITYHLAAMILFKIELFSLSFISLELIFLSATRLQIEPLMSGQTNKLTWPVQFCIFALLLGFINISPRDDHDPKLLNVPFSHRWFMFAPPPGVTGFWAAKVTETPTEIVAGQNKKTLDLNQADIESALSLTGSLRNYKYFHNLRRMENFQLVAILNQKLCESLNLKITTIELEYSGLDYIKKRKVRKIFAPYTCLKGSNL